MDAAVFVQRASALLGPERFRTGLPLAPFTTFRVGGPADWFADVTSAAELGELLTLAADAAVPVTLLGGGSNVVVADEGIRGLVIHPRLFAMGLVRAGVVRAESGATVNGLVRWTIAHGLAGIEEWAGTPGTVGGAICGNAHWRGRNIGDLVHTVMLLTRSGRPAIVPRSEMEFAYDTSRVQRTGETVVWAEFEMAPDASPDALRARARASLAFRKGTQPLHTPSAGCIFQNPDPSREPLPAGVPPSAGALVDRAGLKGRRHGGASISETHANFIVNDGAATASDIRSLVEAARAAVRDRFGVTLRDEVVFLGHV